MRHRVKMVNNFEARLLAEIVDACDVDQIIGRKFVATEPRDLRKIARCNCVSRLATEFGLVLNFVAERFAERVEQFLASHALCCVGQALLLPGSWEKASAALALQLQILSLALIQGLPQAFRLVPVSGF